MTDYAVEYKEGQFNQALAIQMRLDNLLYNIDVLSINLFAYSFQTKMYHYEMVAKAIENVFIAISSLIGKDATDLQRDVELLKKLIDSCPAYKRVLSNGISNKKVSMFSIVINQRLISDTIFTIRLEIDSAMEHHGLGNPSKSDVTRAAVRF